MYPLPAKHTPTPATQTQEVILNYQFPIWQPEDRANANFRLYQIYALGTRLDRFVHSRIKPSLRVDITPMEWEGAMHMCVRLFDGVAFYPVGTELHQELTQFIAEIQDQYCVLCHADRAIIYEDVCFPVPWLSSILPFLSLPYDPWYWKDGALMVDLGQVVNYGERHTQLVMGVLAHLLELWRAGSLVLDPQRDAALIRDWQLVPYAEDLTSDREQSLITQELTIYQPSWTNLWYAPHPTQFLMDLRLSGAPYQLKLEIGLNNVTRHYVALALSGPQPFSFRDHQLLVPVSGASEAERICRQVFKARSRVAGMVEIGLLIPDDENVIDYYDQTQGWVRSRLLQI